MTISRFKEMGQMTSTHFHGMSNHPLYNMWRGMIGRCDYTSNAWHKNYGGRGISVCPQWYDFRVFSKWALSNGWSAGLQIDREENDGNYCPDNCRFVTRTKNMRNCRSNRLLTFEGQTQPVSEWAEQTGMNADTIRSRLRRGWTPEQIFTLASQRGKKP